MSGRLRAARIWQLAALGLAAAAAVVVLFAPLYSSGTTTCDPPGVACAVHPAAQASVLAVNGPGILWYVLAPVALCLIPVLVRGSAWRAVSITCVVVLGMLVLLGLLTIGTFYVPALGAAVAGASMHAPVGGGLSRRGRTFPQKTSSVRE
ncbi:hypothetical protein [Gryllotalpicola protaetiae]|uniref:Uncharacterized protein n=1 Tax=Gryllotalpicola protaetiae TaxID=2419771 RepID=A0A387BP63_9MICO|nr:hypothetical protein [Gryllotalpicola protaetiae]AYG03834.1 hypothetical protein D7I44_09985 [Gryllotalpicola protaetiae]